MDDRNVPDLMASDSEDDDVQTLQSKWLNDDGMHEMKTSHDGIYSPKGLETELNRKSAAKFLEYFDAKIVTVKGHAGFGACGLHCKAFRPEGWDCCQNRIPDSRARCQEGA